MNAIIGYTGFVGSNLIEQMEFDHMYNSKNIEEILNKKYELIVCSGIPSIKWYANKNPNDDLSNIVKLIEILKSVECDRIIHISTIDACKLPIEPYGENRLHAEIELQNIFGEKLTVIRLPSLFGKNLKKNILYDLINNNFYRPINFCDEYQWYDLGNLGNDIKSILPSTISRINLFPEPISIKELVDNFFDVSPENIITDCDSASKYDFKMSETKKYLESKEEVLKKLKRYLNEEIN